MLIGLLATASVVNTSIVIIPIFLTAFFCKVNAQRDRLGLFVLWILMSTWILIKSWSRNSIGEHLLVELFLITVLTACSVVTLQRLIIFGLLFGFSPLVLLDVVSNIMQMTNGTDFLGNVANDHRSDGVRLSGLFGHSFISLGLYLSTFLLLQATGFRRSIVMLPIILLLMVGSFRGYVFLPVYLTYIVLFLMGWRIVFFASMAIPTAIIAATFISVQSGFLTENSGNWFRIIAWQTAASEISNNPLIGTDVKPQTLPDDFSVNESNIIYYQVYESALLRDAVNYGLPFVFIKLIFFYYLGKIHYRPHPNSYEGLLFAKNFIVAFLITDYAVFAFFNMPVTALIAAIILASKDIKPITRTIPS